MQSPTLALAAAADDHRPAWSSARPRRTSPRSVTGTSRCRSAASRSPASDPRCKSQPRLPPPRPRHARPDAPRPRSPRAPHGCPPPSPPTVPAAPHATPPAMPRRHRHQPRALSRACRGTGQSAKNRVAAEAPLQPPHQPGIRRLPQDRSHLLSQLSHGEPRQRHLGQPGARAGRPATHPAWGTAGTSSSREAQTMRQPLPEPSPNRGTPGTPGCPAPPSASISESEQQRRRRLATSSSTASSPANIWLLNQAQPARPHRRCRPPRSAREAAGPPPDPPHPAGLPLPRWTQQLLQRPRDRRVWQRARREPAALPGQHPRARRCPARQQLGHETALADPPSPATSTTAGSPSAACRSTPATRSKPAVRPTNTGLTTRPRSIPPLCPARQPETNGSGPARATEKPAERSGPGRARSPGTEPPAGRHQRNHRERFPELATYGKA